MRYLIIDDNQKMIKIIRQILSVQEFAANIHSDILPEDKDIIIECSDVRNAVAYYEKYQPDYVLIDIQIQKMRGLNVLKEILKEFPDAKIIIITDYDTPSSRIVAMEAGATAFYI